VVFSKLPLAQSIKLVDNKYPEILDILFKADVTGSSNIAFNEISTPPVYQYPIFTSTESQEASDAFLDYLNEYDSIKKNTTDDVAYYKVSKQSNS